MNMFCRICGYRHIEPQWGEDGISPIYDICPCCGVESGNEDYTMKSAKRYRKSWIENGAKWNSPRLKPTNWDLATQMENIPLAFRE